MHDVDDEEEENTLHCRHDVRVSVTNIEIAEIFIVKVYFLCALLVGEAHRQSLFNQGAPVWVKSTNSWRIS